MNPLSKGSPDWSGDISDVTDMWNQLMGGIQPSAAAMSNVSRMQNQMTNQMYNQGLSGSTIESQALGAGEMDAFQQDQMRQAQAAMGMLPSVAQGNMASQMVFPQALGNVLGLGAGLAESFLSPGSTASKLVPFGLSSLAAFL